MGILVCTTKKNELNEYKRRCNALEKQNQALVETLNKVTVLPSTHHDWDYENVCRWIMQIENGKFERYQNVLSHNLKEGDISGKDLCQLDVADIQRLGITGFIDQKVLFSYIQRLTVNDILPQYTYDSLLPFNIQRLITPSLPENKILLSNMSFLSKTKHHGSTESTICDVTSIKVIGSSSGSDSILSQASNEWRYKDGVLSVKVIKATNISDMNETGCYVQLELNSTNQKEQTKVVCHETNPVWNERFPMFCDNPKTDVLVLKIRLKSRWIFDQTVGSVAVRVIDVLTTTDGMLYREFDIGKDDDGVKLRLELQYRELAAKVM